MRFNSYKRNWIRNISPGSNFFCLVEPILIMTKQGEYFSRLERLGFILDQTRQEFQLISST